MSRPSRARPGAPVAWFTGLSGSGKSTIATRVHEAPVERGMELRKLCRGFVEISGSTPLEECERQDMKGRYARARRGEITKFTGIDDPYEPPEHSELVLDTLFLTVDEAVFQVLARLGGGDRS